MKKLLKDRAGFAALTLIIILILLAAAAGAAWYFLAGGNNTGATTTTTTNTQPSAQQQITNNWQRFFNGKTTAATKESLLQNGQQFAQVIQAQSQTPTAQATTATVSNVKLDGSGKATVTYTIYVNGQPTLKDQTGQAVLENNVWKVSDTAFCNLLQLSGNVPPNCPSAGSSSQSTTNETTNSGGTTTNGGTPTGTTPNGTTTQPGSGTTTAQ